jgi:hypothetical protein
VSVAEAYRLVRRTGCVHGTPEELKAQLADIASYLSTTDPIELGAALLLKQSGYERSQLQLDLALTEGDERYVVQLSTEGFQVRDTDTGQLKADVWPSRRQAARACAALNAGARSSASSS